MKPDYDANSLISVWNNFKVWLKKEMEKPTGPSLDDINPLFSNKSCDCIKDKEYWVPEYVILFQTKPDGFQFRHTKFVKVRLVK